MSDKTVRADRIRRKEPFMAGDDYGYRYHAGTPSLHVTEPSITKLYGPNGEVLKTYSDRPPIGFHSAIRS